MSRFAGPEDKRISSSPCWEGVFGQMAGFLSEPRRAQASRI
jgi:hypothetical protein